MKIQRNLWVALAFPLSLISGCNSATQTGLSQEVKSGSVDNFYKGIDLSKSALEQRLSGKTILAKRGFAARGVIYFSPNRKAAAWTEAYSTILHRKWEVRAAGTRKIYVTNNGKSSAKTVKRYNICFLGYDSISDSILNKASLNRVQCLDSIRYLDSQLDKKSGDVFSLLNKKKRPNAFPIGKKTIR